MAAYLAIVQCLFDVDSNVKKRGLVLMSGMWRLGVYCSAGVKCYYYDSNGLACVVHCFSHFVMCWFMVLLFCCAFATRHCRPRHYVFQAVPFISPSVLLVWYCYQVML